MQIWELKRMRTNETFERAVQRHDQQVAELGLRIWVGSEPTFTDREAQTPRSLFQRQVIVRREYLGARLPKTTPPDFSAPGCRTTGLWKVDPQHHSLWLKARIAVPPALLDQSAPLGLFVSGKFASTAWWNGRRIGGNGPPVCECRQGKGLQGCERPYRFG